MFDERPARDTLTGLSRADQITELRRRIAAVPARVGTVDAPPVDAVDVLPIPGALGDALPDGGLPRGGVVACPRGAVLVGLLAAASQAGSVAVLHRPDHCSLGLLAATELGARLDRLALVATPTDRVTEIVTVLTDGVELIVADIDEEIHPRAAAVDAILGRLRSRRTTLIVTGQTWIRPHLQIRHRPVGQSGLGAGHGYLRQLTIEIDAQTRGQRARRTTLTLHGGQDRCQWSTVTPAIGRWAQTG
ncbi:hypothetical protein [Nocardia thailandica]